MSEQKCLVCGVGDQGWCGMNLCSKDCFNEYFRKNKDTAILPAGIDWERLRNEMESDTKTVTTPEKTEKDKEWNLKLTGINARHGNKDYIDKTTAKLLAYYSDPDKKDRRTDGLCKSCFYVQTGRIGGTMPVNRTCANCGKVLHFASTCVDVFCLECAVEIKRCRHCGQRMD